MRTCRCGQDSRADSGAEPGAAGVAGQLDHGAPTVREADVPVRRRHGVARVPGAVGERVRAIGDGEPAGRGGARGAGGAGPLSVRPRRAGGTGQRGGDGASGAQRAAVAGWTGLLGLTTAVFTAPGFAVFTDLLTGWVLTPGRRTITRMLTVADPQGRRAHDAYHRFIRAGRWDMAVLWRVLAVHAIDRFYPDGVVIIDADDTVYHKTGRKINGAGTWRDAVRSTGAKVVHTWGLNLVVITLRVPVPWGGCPLGLPINMRVHPKHGPSTVELAAQMIVEITSWLPTRHLHLHADGAYASLIGHHLPRTVVTSRLRRDAALYEPAPPHTGKPGRPRTKGERLPTPPELADTVTDWTDTEIDIRGRTVTRRLWHRDVLWYRVNPQRLVRLVIARDPTASQPDDFFITSAPAAAPAATASGYAGRWSIEVTNRDAKQGLGGEDPQSWKHQGPARAAALSLWLHTAIWCWYLTAHAHTTTWPARPWYPQKRTASFADALAALRRALWQHRITAMSAHPALQPKITDALLDVLAQAT